MSWAWGQTVLDKLCVALPVTEDVLCWKLTWRPSHYPLVQANAGEIQYGTDFSRAGRAAVKLDSKLTRSQKVAGYEVECMTAATWAELMTMLTKTEMKFPMLGQLKPTLASPGTDLA